MRVVVHARMRTRVEKRVLVASYMRVVVLTVSVACALQCIHAHLNVVKLLRLSDHREHSSLRHRRFEALVEQHNRLAPDVEVRRNTTEVGGMEVPVGFVEPHLVCVCVYVCMCVCVCVCVRVCVCVCVYV
jgi:hypothetical protein